MGACIQALAVRDGKIDLSTQRDGRIDCVPVRVGRMLLSSSFVCEVSFEEPSFIIITRTDIYPTYNGIAVGFKVEE